MRISAWIALLVLTGTVLAAGGIATAGQDRFPTFFTKFKLSANEERFVGKIDSPKRSCVKGRKIVLFRKKGDNRRKIGADKANRKGRFRIGVRGRLKDGTYFAKAKGSNFASGDGDRVTCRPESSARVTVG